MNVCAGAGFRRWRVMALACTAATVLACGGGNRGNDPCNNGLCQVDVFVQDCASGALSVAPDPIDVPGAANIEWRIVTTGFSFPSNGIVIEGTGFTLNPGVNGSGKKFTVHDDHSDRRSGIKYTVRVVRDSDAVACAPLDPRINNL